MSVRGRKRHRHFFKLITFSNTTWISTNPTFFLDTLSMERFLAEHVTLKCDSGPTLEWSFSNKYETGTDAISDANLSLDGELKVGEAFTFPFVSADRIWLRKKSGGGSIIVRIWAWSLERLFKLT